MIVFLHYIYDLLAPKISVDSNAFSKRRALSRMSKFKWAVWLLFLGIYLIVLFLDSKGLVNLLVAFSWMRSNFFCHNSIHTQLFSAQHTDWLYSLVLVCKNLCFTMQSRVMFVKFEANSIAVGMPNAYDLCHFKFFHHLNMWIISLLN
jgi:hypothetical protein